MSVKIGKAKYGGDFKKRNYWKLKDGSSGPYRILPPLGDLADKGRWSVYYNIHYGYFNSKEKMRTFQSPLVKNNKTKMIEVPDAALERIQNLTAQLDAAKAAGNEKLASKILELVGGKKSRFNLDSHHYMNVIDAQGNIGILKIRHRAKQALDAAIKILKEKNIDPLSVEDGRFFVFHRSGTGRDTTFSVSVLTETLNVEGVGEVQRPVVHRLTDDLINRLGDEAAELDKLFKRPTAEEVARIVKEGPKAVDEILDAGNDSSADDAAASQDIDEEDLLNSSAPQTSTPTATVQVPVGSKVTVDQGVATVHAPTQALSPAIATPVTIVPTTVSAPVAQAPATSTAKALEDMSTDEFMAMLGNG